MTELKFVFLEIPVHSYNFVIQYLLICFGRLSNLKKNQSVGMYYAGSNKHTKPLWLLFLSKRMYSIVASYSFQTNITLLLPISSASRGEMATTPCSTTPRSTLCPTVMKKKKKLTTKHLWQDVSSIFGFDAEL